ncbi:MAG: protein kinase, partial [Acidobacteriota bacterium]
MQKRLGSGAFGVVYEAYDRQEQALVALKVLRLGEADALYRFKRGFRSLADIRHPNLVSFYELMNHEDMWFFSMELIPGQELTEAADAEGGSNDFGRVRRLALQLGRGLQHVHEHGMLHRDIKPSNALVTPDDRVKLLDFGLVAELGAPRVSDEEPSLVGTPAYMSPEQATGDAGQPAGDWYGLGVILYQLLTGTLPFSGSLVEILTGKQKGVEPGRLRAGAPDLPEDLEALCLGLLEPDPKTRWTGSQALEILSRGKVRARAIEPSGTGRVFVGREEQLAALDSALKISRERTAVVHVKGLSGMGKSALVEHFAADLEAADKRAVVLRGRCYVQESVPYKALDSLIDALSRFLMEMPRHDAEVLMPTRMADLALLFPVLLRVPAVAQAPAVAARGAESPDPKVLRRRAFSALRELLGRLAVRRTLVLILDDLQWGDLDSLALLDEILRSEDPLPLLLVGCYRSENEASSAFLAAFRQQQKTLAFAGVHAVHLELRELGRGEARRLVEQLAREEGEAPVDLDEVVDDAAGSPLLLSELARSAPLPGPGR